MILPGRQEERNALYLNTIRECLHSQDSRRAYHKRLRGLALQGGDGSQVIHANKLWEWVESSSAHCYAPEFAKFGVTLPKRYGDQWMDELDAVRDEVGDLFNDSGIDSTFGLAVDLAHVYPSMFIKVITSDNAVAPKLIEDPADVGVWEENLPFEDQEALVHTFDMNLHAVIRLISGAITDPEKKEELIRAARAHSTRGPSGGALAPAVPRLVLASAGPINLTGAVQNMQSINLADPEVEADVVPMCELWIHDDLAHPACKKCEHRESDDVHHGALKDHEFVASGEHEWEWRKILAMGRYGDDLLWGALNPQLPQRHPIRKVSLRPITNYAYGVSPMEQLIPLQVMGEELLRKHDKLLDLQLDPPIAIAGMGSVDGERAKLLRTAGGNFSLGTNPMAKVERFLPETPPDAAGMHKLNAELFDRLGGLPMGANAVTDANVRSAGQMTAGAALSSPRTNRRAMRVEDALEEVMTDALRLHRRVSKDPLRIPLSKPDPETGKDYRHVLLSQIPGEMTVRVSAHSASPLFRNEMREMAVILKREGAISKESFIELIAPPLEDILRPKARRMEQAEGQFKERMIETKERESQAKTLKAQKT